MKICYNKLQKLMIDNQMKRQDLMRAAEITSYAATKINKNEPVSLEVLMRICQVFHYEITNSKGEKSTYADALWIDTVLPISQIERYIEKSGVAEPSNISFVGDSDECGNYKV